MDPAELRRLIEARDVRTLRALLAEAREWPDQRVLMLAIELATLPMTAQQPKETDHEQADC